MNDDEESKDYELLALGSVIGVGNAIELQANKDNKEFISNETLPTKMSPEDKNALELWGIQLLGEVPDDPLFQYVRLPDGWEKVPDHGHWSYLRDDKGRRRANIIYTATSYSRYAELTCIPKYWYKWTYRNVPDDDTTHTEYIVISEDQIIYTTGVMIRSEGKVAIEEWLNTNYPDWRNPCAYWD